MTDATLSDVRDILEANNTLTLATCSHDLPWAATVFYASDAKLNLYFVSDRRTRHAREMASGRVISAAINPDCARWSEVHGLQIRGSATVLEGTRRMKALAVFLAKFSDVKDLFEAPKSADEETIGERLKNANLYCLAPDWIRLIDNRRWFGYKAEFDL